MSTIMHEKSYASQVFDISQSTLPAFTAKNISGSMSDDYKRLITRFSTIPGIFGSAASSHFVEESRVDPIQQELEQLARESAEFDPHLEFAMDFTPEEGHIKH